MNKLLYLLVILLLISGCTEQEAVNKDIKSNTLEFINPENLSHHQTWFIMSLNSYSDSNNLSYPGCEDGIYAEDYLWNYERYSVNKSFWEGFCIKELAVNEKNIDLCKNIKSGLVKGLCIMEVDLANNPHFCDSQTGIAKDYCIIIHLREDVGFYPTNNDGVARCNEISNEGLREYCEEAYRRKE